MPLSLERSITDPQSVGELRRFLEAVPLGTEIQMVTEKGLRMDLWCDEDTGIQVIQAHVECNAEKEG